MSYIQFNYNLTDLKTNRAHISNQKKLYWLLQLVGWFSMMFIEIFNFTVFIQGEFRWSYFYSFGVFSVIGIVATHVHKIFFIPKATFDQGLANIWSKALLDVVLISLLIVVLGRLVSIFGEYSFLKLPFKETLRYLLPQFMNIARYVVVWIIIYYLYHILHRNNELQKANLEAENQAKVAELELLKTQLNPYFLFQTLSSLKSLVTIDKEKARDAIIKLSELLRYSLNYEKNSVVSVESELSELNKYLELEKLRLGSLLKFIITIDEKLLTEKLPTAALLNLVENAIRIVNINQENVAHLLLNGKFKDNEIQFSLSQLASPATNQMTDGMENLKLRLKKIYGNEAVLTIEQLTDEMMISTLKLPKKIRYEH